MKSIGKILRKGKKSCLYVLSLLMIYTSKIQAGFFDSFGGDATGDKDLNKIVDLLNKGLSIVILIIAPVVVVIGGVATVWGWYRQDQELAKKAVTISGVAAVVVLIPLLVKYIWKALGYEKIGRAHV